METHYFEGLQKKSDARRFQTFERSSASSGGMTFSWQKQPSR